MRTLLVAALSFALTTGTALAQTLGADRARLLLTRAGFAPSATEVERFAGLTQRNAVDLMLREARRAPVTAPPEWIDEGIISYKALRALGDEAKKAERRTQVRYSLELRGWWLNEMVRTPSPLTERMTLFWHNHFVSAQPKVRFTQLMYRQNALFRQHALGSFRELLHAVAKDPALLIYLDSASNRRAAPNENFAREVMELFTLGEGHYGERDIKEAARAFTGWSVDPDTYQFMLRRGQHDDGVKTVLGRSGRFVGSDVLDVLLAQPAAAEFIVTKLWREFVSPAPDAARVKAIAARFRSSDYNIAVAVREVLLQPELVERSEDNALVKSPVDLLVGLLRQSSGEVFSAQGAAVAVASMGQNLFAAPNVRGWPGGEAWINTQTLLARKQFLDRALAARSQSMQDPKMTPREMKRELRNQQNSEQNPEMGGDDEQQLRRRAEVAQAFAVRIDTPAWLKSSGLYAERIVSAAEVQTLSRQLLVLPAVSAAADSEGKLGMDALRAVLLDPAYQLK